MFDVLLRTMRGHPGQEAALKQGRAVGATEGADAGDCPYLRTDRGWWAWMDGFSEGRAVRVEQLGAQNSSPHSWSLASATQVHVCSTLRALPAFQPVDEPSERMLVLLDTLDAVGNENTTRQAS